MQQLAYERLIVRVLDVPSGIVGRILSLTLASKRGRARARSRQRSGLRRRSVLKVVGLHVLDQGRYPETEMRIMLLKDINLGLTVFSKRACE